MTFGNSHPYSLGKILGLSDREQAAALGDEQTHKSALVLKFSLLGFLRDNPFLSGLLPAGQGLLFLGTYCNLRARSGLQDGLIQ